MDNQKLCFDAKLEKALYTMNQNLFFFNRIKEKNANDGPLRSCSRRSKQQRLKAEYHDCQSLLYSLNL
ncbi:hypothetical protein AZH43_01955 [Acinetobacter pragensis]|uniref:Uncharacterized protein n=1 Tax=Acinetobacter pragensis TaxID=1806892 RepID=A0A151Y147_9GAMM|nr:hypothetical protein AZH43_01955 [Acinetobacter pragensis]